MPSPELALGESGEPNKMNEHKLKKPDSLRAKLLSVDNGRFKDVLVAIKVKKVCWECAYFIPPAIDPTAGFYRCKCMPLCIATTLSPELLSYLLWKVELLAENDRKKYEEYLKPGGATK